jgi:rare lipoprotein A (peptidoglycan hydrolase)
VIDVSWEAARRLGFLTVGLTPVQIEVMGQLQLEIR